VSNALAHFGFPVLPHALCQRVIYAESAAQGLAVIEADPKSEAAIEMAQLAALLVEAKTKAKTKKERRAA
jgi:chromosome partitioning protein